MDAPVVGEVVSVKWTSQIVKAVDNKRNYPKDLGEKVPIFGVMPKSGTPTFYLPYFLT